MYHYFVSYVAVDNNSAWGFYSCDVKRSLPITSMDDINSIREMIAEKYGFSDCSILNYQLLRKDD